MLETAGYRLLLPEGGGIKAFAQFVPCQAEGFRVDLMLVDDATFARLLAGSEWFHYGHRRVRVLGVLHLIALKLHALRNESRVEMGRDYGDILALVRRNRVDTAGAEFQEILARYASEPIRQRLLRDLGESL